MGIIIAYSKRGTARVKVIGRTVDNIALASSICKGIAHEVAQEKRMKVKEAEKLVGELVVAGIEQIKE